MHQLTCFRRRRLPFTLLGVFAGLAIAGAAWSAAPKPKGKKDAAEAPKYGNADAITQEEMKIYLYFLASDQLEGRNLPSRGYDTAALYVASHLAEWGLKPGGSTEKTDGPLQPYFMPIELQAQTVVPDDSSAAVIAPAEGRGEGGRGSGRGGRGGDAANAMPGLPAKPQSTSFEYGKEWTVNAGGRGAVPLEPMDITANMVFVGNGYTVKKGNIDPYAGLDVKDKVVVVAGLPPEIAAQQAAAGQGRGGGGRGPNPLGEPCDDFMTPEQAAAKNGAVAVVTLVNYQELAGGGRGGFGRGGAGLNGPNYRVPKLSSSLACPAVPGFTVQLPMASTIFQGEKMNASQIFFDSGAGQKLDSFALKPERKIKFRVATKIEQNHGENVIGIVEGSDPVLKNQYVVISAHLDHIGFSAPLPNGDNINNGADDDGSGSTALLAMARTYAEGAAKGIRPRRSIIFLWNAGEEKGLWGSQYFSEYPPVDPTKIVADLNIDMIGRTKGPGFTDPDKTHVLVDPGEILLIGPQISSNDLEKTIETVNNGYQKLTLNHFYDVTKPDATHDNLGPQPNGQRIFYRSDHYNFAKVGIPIAFFTTGLHPDYHRPTDSPEKIDYKEMQVVTKTVAAVGWQLAMQDGRPEVNTTLPDQLIKDMKSAKEKGWGTVTPVQPPLPKEPF